jgi:hypothetical protein
VASKTATKAAPGGVSLYQAAGAEDAIKQATVDADAQRRREHDEHRAKYPLSRWQPKPWAPTWSDFLGRYLSHALRPEAARPDWTIGQFDAGVYDNLIAVRRNTAIAALFDVYRRHEGRFALHSMTSSEQREFHNELFKLGGA